MTTIADICLYGNRETGAGWLARTSDGTLLGDGHPRSGRNFTEAVWIAAAEIVAHEGANGRECQSGRVFATDGKRMAIINLHCPPWFGNLQWQPAPVLEISAEAIRAAGAVIDVAGPISEAHVRGMIRSQDRPGFGPAF